MVSLFNLFSHPIPLLLSLQRTNNLRTSYQDSTCHFQIYIIYDGCIKRNKSTGHLLKLNQNVETQLWCSSGSFSKSSPWYLLCVYLWHEAFPLRTPEHTVFEALLQCCRSTIYFPKKMQDLQTLYSFWFFWIPNNPLSYRSLLGFVVKGQTRCT